MNFDFHYPKEKALSKFIEFYYTGSINKFYFAYPHYNNPLSFIKNSEVTIYKYGIDLESRPDYTSKIIVAKKNVFPIYINPINEIKEFCIVFKPYGLSQFLENPITSLKEDKPVITLVEFEDFYTKNKGFFQMENSEKIDVIELYLMNRLFLKNNLEQIISSIDYFNNENIKITDIISKTLISLKTYNRSFNLNCGVSPVKFKRIIHFRNAIEKIKDNETEKLKEIAIDCGYYDQAAFNNEFKKMSQLLPKDFFKKMNILLENKIYFNCSPKKK
ncbi:MAG: AraC family transcriptional regulator [Flavobacterium sp.]|nr:AraC family transcriptional regulator [Flavobacterium sp.]